MSVNCPGGQTYIIRSGDTYFSLARRFNVTVAQIEAANPGVDPNNLQIGQEICIPVPAVPCPGGTLYTIVSGDTLFAIARRAGITVQEILAANPGLDPNNLQVGRIICIPGPPVPVPRPRCFILSPTDIAPNSKGMVFVERDLNSIVGLVTNVPDPTVLPGGEVYKLWVRAPGATTYAVTTMTEVFTDYWIGRIVSPRVVPGADVLITAEAAANVTAPAGLGVAVGTI